MKCPCKGCIVYAICINKEECGCELTDRYIGKRHHSTKAQKRIKETRNFLKRDAAVGPHVTGVARTIRFYNIRWVAEPGSRCAK
jgi:hypothetical protein